MATCPPKELEQKLPGMQSIDEDGKLTSDAALLPTPYRLKYLTPLRTAINDK
ncbi:MAG: hypothetical protein F6K65_29455 [Moorea sp. SIO3C2]|nr:hypothetical protein [Moorena sp. SIO3C2]